MNYRQSFGFGSLRGEKIKWNLSSTTTSWLLLIDVINFDFIVLEGTGNLIEYISVDVI